LGDVRAPAQDYDISIALAMPKLPSVGPLLDP